jgi:crotonobetainyl-CoA:carnitine CoA-transferase CaiB-like acyl-CoA transferase
VAVTLDGLRVLDLTTIIAGPACTRTLATFGADVVKIDRPGPDRPLWFPHLHIDAHRGKRHVLLDLEDPVGRDTFLGLADGADVIVENARPGVWDRLGIGYDVMSERRPSIVWTSVRLFSGEHTAAAWPGYETTAQAVSGLAVRFGGTDGAPRRAGGGAIDDYAAGVSAAFATVLAVMQAQRSGVGRRVETSLVGVATLYQSFDVVDPSGWAQRSCGGLEARGSSPECRSWPASDGWVHAVLRDTALEEFARALGTPCEGEAIEAATATHPCEELIAVALGAGGFAVRVHDDESLRADLERRGRFRTVDQPAWGRVGHVGHPVTFTPPLGDPWRPAPGWGEHTDEVLGALGRHEDGQASAAPRRPIS